jgi:hypothetical protein
MSFEKFISEINKKLEPFFLQIRKGTTEKKESLYFLVNSKRGEEFAKHASSYSPAEMNLFKDILTNILNQDLDSPTRGYITMTKALDLSREITPKIDMKSAENVIYKLEEEKWLFIQNKENISVGVRSAIEMYPWMEETYKDKLRSCKGCQEPVFLVNKNKVAKKIL